jgi:hypothetical protein
MTFQKYPDWWLKIFIVLGLIGTVLSVVLPAAFLTRWVGEGVRFKECVEHKRADCQSSVMWTWNDWSLDSTSTVILPSTEGY